MRPLSRPPSRPARLAAAALAGALALGLGACSADDESGGGAAGSGADLATQSDGGVTEESRSAPAPGVASPDKAQGTTTVIAAVADRKLARRAEVSLRVEDVTAAAARLRAIASGSGGLVVAEEVSSDPGDGPVPLGDDSRPRPQGWGSVTISVPAERLDATLDEVAKVGTVLTRRTGTSDVTGQYVDTASRVESLKASVERVRALMSRATKLADIVTLEAELSRRQADLESMQQQLAALDDRVELAPISVTLSTGGDVTTTTEDPTGFLAGLASGWAAFTTSVRLLLTLVGALLPFAVATAVVVVPLVAWWRRRVRPVEPATPPVAPTA